MTNAFLRGLLSIIALDSMFSGVSHATTYYIDNSGNDSNPGTSASAPWQTVAKVNNSVFQPGDTISFKRGGLWREGLAPRSGGTASSPVTFTAYGTGALPILSGADTVSGWSVYSGSIYQSTITTAPGNVWADELPGWGLREA